MKIVHNNNGEYGDVINSYYDIERFNDDSETEVLFLGYNTSINESLKQKFESYERKIYINLEAPCSFLSATPNAITTQDFFDEVYTICPYTSEWLNGSEKTKTKYIPIPFPFRKGCFGNIDNEKDIDVIYMGHVFGSEHNQMLEVMKDYNYCFCSIGCVKSKYITHLNLPSAKKWNMLSRSKVSVALNVLHPNAGHINNLKTYKGWESNKAFSDKSLRLIPQFKPRIIEAACCKTLNLVMRDEWNVIEEWFEPEKDFVYWSTASELKDRIDDVKNNFENYQPIINNAYDKVMNYDIDTLMKRIRSCDV